MHPRGCCIALPHLTRQVRFRISRSETFAGRQARKGSVPESSPSGKRSAFAAVNSRYACSLGLGCFWFLFCTRHCRSLFACAVHFVGGFRCPSNALAPGSSLAAHRFASLGNPYRSSSVAVSIDAVGKLARRPRWCRAIPGRISAPLSGQACVSRYFRERSHHRGGRRMHCESGFLRSTRMDQPARSTLTAFRFIHPGSSRRPCHVPAPFIMSNRLCCHRSYTDSRNRSSP